MQIRAINTPIRSNLIQVEGTTLLLNLPLWITPKRCCSSTTAMRKAENSTFSAIRLWVPMTNEIFPVWRPCQPIVLIIWISKDFYFIHKRKGNNKRARWEMHASRIIRDCFDGVEPVSNATEGLHSTSSIFSSRLSKCS